MEMRLLSLHTSPTILTSKFTTGNASNSRFFSSVPVTILSSRTLQLERRHRMLVPVPRAGGPPSTNSLLFAFLLPFSLIVGTVWAAIKIGDKLDQKFLDEIERNIAIMEEDEMEYDEISEEIEDENAEAVESEELVSATAAQSQPKQEL
ncbi:high chlorophyll fluorescence 153 [Carex rostrata]